MGNPPRKSVAFISRIFLWCFKEVLHEDIKIYRQSDHADFEASAILHLSPELCREHGMSSATFYKWPAKYGGMDASMVSRLKELEDENRRLKKMNAQV